MGDFAEDKHARDDKGKFTEGGGSDHTRTVSAKAHEASASAKKAGTGEAHSHAAGEHKKAAKAERAAAEKEKDPQRRSEHLARAAKHDGHALNHGNEAVKKGVDKQADEKKHEVGKGKAALFHKLAGKGSASASKDAPHKGSGSKEHGEKKHGGSKEHGHKGSGSHESKTAEFLEKLKEGMKEKAEGIKRVEEQALSEGGLGKAAMSVAGGAFRGATSLPSKLVPGGGEKREKAHETLKAEAGRVRGGHRLPDE